MKALGLEVSDKKILWAKNTWVGNTVQWFHNMIVKKQLQCTNIKTMNIKDQISNENLVLYIKWTTGHIMSSCTTKTTFMISICTWFPCHNTYNGKHNYSFTNTMMKDILIKTWKAIPHATGGVPKSEHFCMFFLDYFNNW